LNAEHLGVGRGGGVDGLGLVTDTLAGVPLLEVTGEVDLHTAPRLQAALEPLLAAAGPHRPDLVVDLSAVTFLDSTGLGELVAAHKVLVSRGARLHLISGNDRVGRLLAITGLDGVLDVHPDREVVLAALTASPPHE
jgi:anti-sigma B factor antagonist